MTASMERTDTSDMIIVHRLFRREFRRAPRLILGVAEGDTERAEFIGSYLADIAAGLHHHHHAEDELLWPKLLERVSLQAELIHRMEGQHERLAVLLGRIDELLPVWRTRAEASVRDELADVIAQASGALDEHLGEEESEILPLVAEHLSPDEWEAIGKRAQEGIPKEGTKPFVALGALLDEASPTERRFMLAKLPLPLRVIYGLIGERIYRRAMTRLVGTAN
ncbi:hemerythrin domain-containing protein [Tenggerimyces flavus]|uniref:Hemerythrin domain-containing protein n=1 Tax=Tenggerimyces flavus TaxID=1708749 RepID=A0ABV7YFW5_9ACTN|nr:hemerythrin domain-containing protein [Tenggerimyces flavus]MBM7784547.1 hemerythrin-like domain-containing protein [Tenggerimyces flavus]